MNEQPKSESDGEASLALEALLEEWGKTLPKEFTLGTVGNGASRHKYPNLHFTADEKIPGLYYADLDPQALVSNGNGHGGGMDLKQEDTEAKKG